MPSDRPISTLVLAELYDSGDAAFLNLLLQYRGNFKPLLGFVEHWKKDALPWARQLRIEFVLRRDLTLESRIVFKRLFKQAWAARDHELMGACLVAVDRMIRRKRAKRFRFYQNVFETSEVLRVPRPKMRVFSTATTHYLRRRAWRYFRRLGYSDPSAYIKSIAELLTRFTDDDMRLGENLLDNWGLMHACFGKSPVLAFNARHTNLSPSGRLTDLQAAPMFERHWAKPEAMSILLDALLRAQCRPVRVWAIQVLNRLHIEALPKIDAAILLRLIDHSDADVAGFAAGLLSNAQTVSSFPMATWMNLLATRNPAVVATICDVFRKHVSFDRATLAQAIELATRAAVQVATLGMDILAGKAIRAESEYHEMGRLSAARCSAMGSQIALYALSRLNVPKIYRLDDVVPFFDSNLKSLRDGAFESLARQSPADMDPAFWARLFESPYDDVRIELVGRLKARGNLPGASTDTLASLWQTVLLNIHRGGRAKLSALKQISSHMMGDPNSAKLLLPVLAVAIRSVRPPEACHGLSAIVSVVEKIPALANEVSRQLPELQFDLAGAAR